MHKLTQHYLSRRSATTMHTRKSFATVTLPKNSNQARGLGEYAIEFMKMDHKKIDDEVYKRVQLFHTDSVICGISAIAMRTNAPNILRDEAINLYSVNPDKKMKNSQHFLSKCFGSKLWVHAEKAIAANASAVREWDMNGTVFGFDRTIPGHNAGEFGHNDYYSVVLAACHNNPEYNGMDMLKGMILIDEIRGRLAEVFSLKTYKIDHVVHGGIAAAVTYGAMLGATPE